MTIMFPMGLFATLEDAQIKRGDCTDVYFVRTEDVLEKSGKNPFVAMEVTAATLPGKWGILCGLADVISLLEGLPVSVDAMPEGNIFYPGEPVLRVSGKYRDFARYETSILGFLCHASGIATAAAHARHVARGKKVYSFGSRRQHPAISVMVERAAWIGGVDGVSNIASPAGIPLAGTMPHSFVMCYKRPEDAFVAFSRHAPPDVPRIFLCDTFCDEKKESLIGARCGAAAVRLDTPRSRRGDMRTILEEVRWELDAAGYHDVSIFLSGGVTLRDIATYRDLVDAFGIGGAIANAPVVDFGMDIVEIEGRKCAKRGKRSGVKQVWEISGSRHITLPADQEAPGGGTPLLEPVIRNGMILATPSISDVRARVIAMLESLEEAAKDQI